MSVFPSQQRQSASAFGQSCVQDTPDARLRLAAMTTMASTLAHEVNQPLTAATNYIHASARRLRQQGPEFEDVIAMIEEAGMQTVKAGDIIHRMRSFIVSGKITGRRESLHAILDKVGSTLVCPDGAEIQILKEIQPEASFVTVERVQIEQVFSNILENACKALTGCSFRRVRISAARHSDHVLVKIIDSGPGFSSHALSRLFDPLFTTSADGLGLGMPISKTIVDAHGGKLWAENLVGEGACFNLLLPAAD